MHIWLVSLDDWVFSDAHQYIPPMAKATASCRLAESSSGGGNRGEDLKIVAKMCCDGCCGYSFQTGTRVRSEQQAPVGIPEAVQCWSGVQTGVFPLSTERSGDMIRMYGALGWLGPRGTFN